MKVQGKLTFMWILQSHNFQKILLCFAPGVSISPFLETHGLNYTEKLTSTKWGFLLVATGVCPLLSARHPFLPGPFRVVGACPKSSVSFAAVPSCPRQQSASCSRVQVRLHWDLFIQMVNSFSNVQGKTSQKNYNTNLAALEFLFPCFIWWNLTTCLLKIGLGKPNSLKEPSNLSLQLFSIMLNPKLMDRQTSHLNW